MSDTFQRHEDDESYTVVPNHIAQNKTLSLEAIGLMTFMLSLPKDWKYHKEWLQKDRGIGRDKLQRLIKEIKDNGYLSTKAQKDDTGKWAGQQWMISSKKQVKSNNTNDSTVLRVSSDTGNQYSGKPVMHTKETSIQNKHSYKRTTTTTKKPKTKPKTKPKASSSTATQNPSTGNPKAKRQTLALDNMPTLFDKFLDDVAMVQEVSNELSAFLHHRHSKFQPDGRTESDYRYWMQNALRMSLEDLENREVKKQARQQVADAIATKSIKQAAVIEQEAQLIQGHRSTTDRLTDTSWADDDWFNQLED